jgi:hypothetical protein
MSGSCEPNLITNALELAAWLGSIIRSLFPWPAVVLFAFLFPPLRGGLDRIVESVADSIRTLRRLKAVGVELTLDPQAALEIAAKSDAVVLEDYHRVADQEVARLRVWNKFNDVIERSVRPLAKSGFRSTIHIEDTRRQETFYQLVEYVYVSEQSGDPKTRGRRNSIRFGIIGRAWRLGRSEYDPNVTTDVTELVKVWGMTHGEAVRAGRGRRSFAVILLRDLSGGYSGLIFIDAQSPNLFGQIPVEELERKLNEVATGHNGLSESLRQVRSALAQQFRGPMQQ